MRRDKIEAILEALPLPFMPSDIPDADLMRQLLIAQMHTNYLLAAILVELQAGIDTYPQEP